LTIPPTFSINALRLPQFPNPSPINPLATTILGPPALLKTFYFLIMDHFLDNYIPFLHFFGGLKKSRDFGFGTVLAGTV
jgi:hypothetical protein